MSAWLVMSAMGFYPVSPGSPEYVIGTPWFPEVDIHLEGGKVFEIRAHEVSKKNFYIQSAQLNGQEYTKSWLSHADIMQGGELRFKMGSSPNHTWGSHDEDVPKTEITEEILLPVPYVIADDYRIRDSLKVSFGKLHPKAVLFYTMDGSVPDSTSQIYEKPFYVRKSTTVQVIAWTPELGYSYPVEAEFISIDQDRKVQLNSTPHPNYHGDGPDALIDGIRGESNWRLGGWQGYQGTDFEAIVDLGSLKDVEYVGAGFTQDLRSWILMPKRVIYSVSVDGKTWSVVARMGHSIAADDYTIQQKELGSKVNARARFVKVNAEYFGKLPDWHLGAGGEAYIFIDEILVR